jgi:hypothetical protein
VTRVQWPTITILMLALMAEARAHAEGPDGGNLLQQHGVLRVGDATPNPSGYIGIGTDFQYFKVSGFLSPNQDHARMVNTYAINWAPWKFFEVAFAMHVTSDNSVTTVSPTTQNEELQVAVGDPEIAIKGGVEVGGGVSVGGLLDLRFPSGAGFFEASGAATNVFFAVLGSWHGPSSVPIGVHLNIGFLRDGSSNLFEKLQTLTPAQLFSAQVSSFNRVITRLAVEYVTRYVGPFLEMSLEPYVGDGNPGFGRSPGIVSLGLRAWPTKARGLQLLAAVDIGVTGVGDGTPTVSGNNYSIVIPRWNLLLQASYRFDVFAKPEVKVAGTGGTGGGGDTPPPPSAESGVIQGTVLDAKTGRPIWNARIGVEGEEASSLAVNPTDGSFRTYKVRAGKATVLASADGYAPGKLEVQVTADGTVDAPLKLDPRASIVPGTLRGTVKAMAGRLASATVLIPEIDKTIDVGTDGMFTVSLKPGEYKIVVSARGFRTQTKSIRIQEGSTIILNVDLYK